MAGTRPTPQAHPGGRREPPPEPPRQRPRARSPAHEPGRAPGAGHSEGLALGAVAQRRSGRARGPLTQVWSLRTGEEGRPARQRRGPQPAEQLGRGGGLGVVWAGPGREQGRGLGGAWAGPCEASACERFDCRHAVLPEHPRKAVAEASGRESRHLPEGRPQATASRDRVESRSEGCCPSSLRGPQCPIPALRGAVGHRHSGDSAPGLALKSAVRTRWSHGAPQGSAPPDDLCDRPPVLVLGPLREPRPRPLRRRSETARGLPGAQGHGTSGDRARDLHSDRRRLRPLCPARAPGFPGQGCGGRHTVRATARPR